MSNILKSWKTTTVAVVGLLLGIGTFIFWFIGKVDNEGLAIGLSGIATFTTMLGLLFAKDSDQSHSNYKAKNNAPILDPNNPKTPPKKG